MSPTLDLEKLKQEMGAPTVNGGGAGAVKPIRMDRPGAEWQKDILAALDKDIYLYAENLCILRDDKLYPLGDAEFAAFADNPERCVFERESRDGTLVRANFQEKHARLLIAAAKIGTGAGFLRRVETLSPVPVLAWDGQQARLVTGYCPKTKIYAGGGGLLLPSPAVAAGSLSELLCDFDFVSFGDKGSALALLLSLALAQGAFLGMSRAPFFQVQKDSPGAGGSLLLKLVAGIYGLSARPITQSVRADRVNEAVSCTLLAGDGFVYIDNLRGDVMTKLPWFESMLTEPTFQARIPYKIGTVNVERRVFAASSNGCVLSPDLASRTVTISLRKRPPGYAWRNWSGGELLEHAKAEQSYYLACIFSLVKAWADAGRPPGKNLTGFRFTQWEAVCAWILETYFPECPLFDANHEETRERAADPDYDMLKSLFRLVVQREFRGELSVTTLAEMAVAAGLLGRDIPNPPLRMGKMLHPRFPDDGEHTFAHEEFRVVRSSRPRPNGKDQIFLTISKPGCD